MAAARDHSGVACAEQGRALIGGGQIRELGDYGSPAWWMAMPAVAV
jgi:hypothetical protein